MPSLYSFGDAQPVGLDRSAVGLGDTSGIDWSSLLKQLESLSSAQRSGNSLGSLATPVNSVSTAPVMQLQPMLIPDPKKQKQSSSGDIAEYAQILGAIFGFGG